MVIATVQGKKLPEGIHTTVLNGRLVEGEEKEKCQSQISDITRRAHFKFSQDEIIKKVPKTDWFICLIYHLDRDDAGRLREAVVIWDKDDMRSDDLYNTLYAMGLSLGRWQKLYDSYLRRAAFIQIAVFAAIGVIAGALIGRLFDEEIFMAISIGSICATGSAISSIYKCDVLGHLNIFLRSKAVDAKNFLRSKFADSSKKSM
ncbi:hypothetical protein BKN38_08130 [Helicobacter sp. CLO-3]|uniref:hypothetical protein n=1 Tax=unclassified Helicobacter TaxID=2593540 RepID=UPI000805A50F|nr:MULTISPECIES: hypothetical protein [unclassified Helicobacter]OBV28747.1 hypothetical protein BA723_08135 [Helicobacter sp. CLO-3]OHU81852.1 hypothetical protein BKN38_08130 [Helicobacter sp. CLO-3]